MDHCSDIVIQISPSNDWWLKGLYGKLIEHCPIHRPPPHQARYLCPAGGEPLPPVMRTMLRHVTMWGLPEAEGGALFIISTNSAQLGGGVFIVSCWAIQCFYQVWRKQVEFYCTGPGVKWICITTFVVYLSSVIAICITSVHTFSAPSISIVLSLVTLGSSFKLAHERFLLITITQTCSN